jgi:hypothetical protein
MINVKPFMVHDDEAGSGGKWLAGFPEELIKVLLKNGLDNEWAGNLYMSSNCEDFVWATMRVVPLRVILESPVDFLWLTSDCGRPVFHAACYVATVRSFKGAGRALPVAMHLNSLDELFGVETEASHVRDSILIVLESLRDYARCYALKTDDSGPAIQNEPGRLGDSETPTIPASEEQHIRKSKPQEFDWNEPTEERLKKTCLTT